MKMNNTSATPPFLNKCNQNITNTDSSQFALHSHLTSQLSIMFYPIIYSISKQIKTQNGCKGNVFMFIRVILQGKERKEQCNLNLLLCFHFLFAYLPNIQLQAEFNSTLFNSLKSISLLQYANS